MTDTPQETAFLFDQAEFQPPSLEICNVAKSRGHSGLEDLDDKLLRRAFPVQRHATIGRIAEAGLPAPGEQLRLVTVREFSAIEIIDYILERERIEEAALVVYSINRINAVRLKAWVLAGKIGRLDFLISNLRNTAAQEKEEAALALFKDTPGLSVFFASSHAKIFTCRTASGQHYTVEGSGNLAHNSRIEQYTIDNAPDLYAFHRAWIAEVQAHRGGAAPRRKPKP